MSQPVSKKAKPARVTRKGSCPAIHAAVSAAIDGRIGAITDLEALIREDSLSVMAVDKNGETALHLAMYAKPELVATLVRNGAPIGAMCNLGYTPLHRAAQRCPVEFITALLPPADGGGDSGDVATSEILNAQIPTGETPLHLACQACSVEAVRALISRGAEINLHAGDVQRTPLHVIAKKCVGSADQMNAERIVKLLLKAGADIAARDKHGDTPLHLAVINTPTAATGSIPIVDRLLSGGANTELLNEEGDSPLHLAACYGKIAAVKALIAAGADKGLLNGDGKAVVAVAHRSVKQLLMK